MESSDIYAKTELGVRELKDRAFAVTAS